MPSNRSKRVCRDQTLDGIRGCLALIVVVQHTLPSSLPLLFLSRASVLGFFILSGLVLTRSWDGDYLRFLARRFVRLWPIYALTLAAGYALQHRVPQISEFFWWPLLSARDPLSPNGPAWSLCIEAWAMPFMPLLIWAGRGSLYRAMMVMAVCELAGLALDVNFAFGVFFIIGTLLARFSIDWAPMKKAIPQFLGRISYPLYLSHWLVLRYGPASLPLRLLIAFALATMLTLTIERWSILASRALKPSSTQPSGDSPLTA